MYLDSYIRTHKGHPIFFDRLKLDVALPDSRIGSTRIVVETMVAKESDASQVQAVEGTYKYSDLANRLGDDKSTAIDDNTIETFLSSNLEPALGFKLPITTIQYASSASRWIFILELVSVSFTALAIVLQLVFRAQPDSFILKPGIAAKVSLTKKEMLRSGLPGFCLLTSACISMMHAVISSSFVHNMVFRLVAYSIFNSDVGSGNIAGFRVAMKGSHVSAKQEQLKLMQYIGRFLTNADNVSYGLSFFAVLASIGLNMTVLFVLYYMDNLSARAKTNAAAASAVSQASPTEIAQRNEAQWKALPWHCQVRPLWISSLVFVFGLMVTAVGGNVARRRGVKMNRHPFEVDGERQTFIYDVIISRTSEFFFSTAGIVDAAVMIFMPLLVMVAISSLDRKKFASKTLELFGVIFFMRGLSVMATIMPTLFNVLQHPQCWDKPGDKLSDMLAEKEFCNDLMFSGHTVFCFLPALIFVFSIVYGPYSYKPALILSVLIAASALTSLIIIGRLHYTADIIVAITLTSLLVVMNAPVWKLQFSFRKSQLGAGSVSAIDKVPGYLEMCVERLNLFASAVQDTYAGEEGDHAESWAKIDATYAQLGELIQQAMEDSAEAEKLEALDDVSEIEEIREDEREPLLNTV